MLLMFGAAGTCISLVIVGGIIGAYGANLMSHESAGWAGIAFIYIYDINFSYSFGKPLPSSFPVITDSTSAHRLGLAIRDIQPVCPLKGNQYHHFRDLDE